VFSGTHPEFSGTHPETRSAGPGHAFFAEVLPVFVTRSEDLKMDGPTTLEIDTCDYDKLSDNVEWNSTSTSRRGGCWKWITLSPKA
jgi:hypothetical protein